MATFHVATNHPPKSELIAEWLVDRSWHSSAGGSIEVVGSFHLEDPAGEVGMQVHLVESGAETLQVPLTYRGERLPEAEEAYIGAMEHSVLGTRHVYDGLGDERFVSVLAGVAACGYGQTLGFAVVDGRLQAWPETARLVGFGSLSGLVSVDGFEPVEIADSAPGDVVVCNEQLQLTVARVLSDRPAPPIGLAATWPGQDTPVVLASVEELDQV